MNTCVLPNPRLVTSESKLCCSCFALCSLQHFEQRPDQAGLPKKPQPDLHSSSDFSTFSLLCRCSAPAPAILLRLTSSETAVEAVETRSYIYILSQSRVEVRKSISSKSFTCHQ